jgi:hypothetical protein
MEAGLAAIDIATARAIAAEHSDDPLADHEPVIDETPSGRRFATFAALRDGQAVGQYRIDLDQGCFFSWIPDARITYDPEATPLTDDQALDRARDVAERHLGEAARTLEWEVLVSDPEEVKFRGRAPMSGDPPRTGLGPECHVFLLRAGGVVTHYVQTLPQDTAPVPIQVAQEQALQTAKAELGIVDVPVLREPRLSQHGGEARWTVYLGASEDEERQVVIDAQTGEVVSTNQVDSATATAATNGGSEPKADEPVKASTTPAPTEAKASPLLWVGLAVAALGVIGIAVVAKRRFL